MRDFFLLQKFKSVNNLIYNTYVGVDVEIYLNKFDKEINRFEIH